MALDDQQKKQAVVLFLLVGVLGVVFYFADPLGLFKKESAIPPEVKKKLDDQAKLAAAASATAKPDDKSNTQKPVTNTSKPKTIPDISKTTMDYDELIPEVMQLDISKQFDPKTKHRDEIFINLSSSGKVGPKTPPLKISSYTSSNGVNKVKFSNLTGMKKDDFLTKGDEFYFQNVNYRILDIDISYDRETKTQVRVIIMDLTGKDTKLTEHTIYYPQIK